MITFYSFAELSFILSTLELTNAEMLQYYAIMLAAISHYTDCNFIYPFRFLLCWLSILV